MNTFSSSFKMLVSSCSSPECIRVLLKHGANARCEDDDNTTPLDLAKDMATKKLLSSELRKQDREWERSLNGA